MEWNRDTSWRQGHFLGDDAISALGLPQAMMPDQTLVIVATHDCDLAQAPDVEPRIELIAGRSVISQDGNCTHAKNARKLHLEFSGQVVFWGEFEATAKISIHKNLLNQFIPRNDAFLSPEKYTIFQMWLASRYRRSAFPDEFERRLTSKEFKLHEKIAKAVKPHGELIVGVFFDVDEGHDVCRVGADDTYTLDILILHSADFDFDDAERKMREVTDTIRKAFTEKLFEATRTWKHIELRYCDSVAETVLTYQEFKRLKRWRLEHISLGSEPQQPLLAE